MALDKARVPYELLTYEHDPAVQNYGMEAAEALGLPPASVFKTLLVEVDGKLGVGIVPVDSTLDLKAVAGALGGRKAQMADPALAERTTGYVVGGISPIGQKKALPTVLDVSAEAHDTVAVSGGKRGLDILLAPSELLRMTRGVTAGIARRKDLGDG